MILGRNRDAATGGSSLQEKSRWISLSQHHNGGRGARGAHREAPAFSGYYRAIKAAGRAFIPGSVDAILLETPLEGSPAPARPRAAARSLCWSARGCSIPASRNKPPPQAGHVSFVEPWPCSGRAAWLLLRVLFSGALCPCKPWGSPQK